MIPFEAALSSCESASETTAASPLVRAFLTSVLRRVFVSRFRTRRLADWRVHFSAALMLGKAAPGGE